MVTGILTIAGTLLGVWLTRRGAERDLTLRLEHERQGRNETLLRERAEEFYVLLEDWTNLLSSHSLSLSMVMRGKLSYNQHLDLLTEGQVGSPVHFARLEMLLNFYMPHLIEQFHEVLEARSALNKISAEHKQAYERGETSDERFLKLYVTAVRVLEEKVNTLK